MPEGIMVALWAFCWGVAAASGGLVGAILGLIAHCPPSALTGQIELIA